MGPGARRLPKGVVRAREPGVGWLVALWLICVMGGLVGLTSYEGRPGPAGSGPASGPEAWPSQAFARGPTPRRTPGRPSVVMAVHPGCVCSEASLIGLETLASGLIPALDVTVMMMGEVPDTGTLTGVLEGLQIRWPQLCVLREVPPSTLAELGAVTSGHVVIFDGAGRTVYMGGLTAGRGHVGPSRSSQDARHVLERLVSGSLETDPHEFASIRRTTPVYGCLLSGAQGPTRAGR